MYDEKKNGPLTEEELNVKLDFQVREAMNQSEGELSALRESALRAYKAEKMGTERKGRSAYVSPVVFENIEWVHADVLRVFTSNERYAQFKPLNPADEKQAEQESDIVHYYLSQGAKGFLLMYDWTKDTLLYPNGYALFGWSDTTQIQERTFEGVDPMVLGALLQSPDDEIEVLAHREYIVEVPLTPDVIAQLSPEAQQEAQMTGTAKLPVYDVDVKRTIRQGEPEVRAIPPDQVYVSARHTSIDLDDADFCGFWESMTVSELIEAGYDRNLIDKACEAGGDDDVGHDAERTERNETADEYPYTDPEEIDYSMKRLKVEYLYPLVDFDGDGIAERRRVIRANGVILENKADDFVPLVAMAAVRIPHRHPGMGYAQMCTDLQKVKSTLLRGILDNLYATNGRRKLINYRSLMDDGSTMKDLANPNAELIRVKGDPRAAILPEPTSPIMSELMPAVEYFDQRTRIQTGVAPDTNVDPEMLQRVASDAAAAARSSGNKRTELLVRVMAETGVKKGFQKLHQLLKTHQTKPLQVKLHNRTWAQVDPRDWPDRNDVIVSVGLGFQNREQMLQMLFGILDVQIAKVAPFNMAQPMNIWATVSKIIEVADIGDPSKFFTEPDPAKGWKPPEPPPPDPLQMAQAEAYKAQAQKLVKEEERRVAELQAKTQADAQKHQLETIKMQLAEATAARDHERQMTEAARAQWETEQKYALENRKNLAEIRNKEADTEKKLAEAEATEKESERPRPEQGD